MSMNDEQMQDTLALLAVCIERAGGHVEVSGEELAASKARYGIPAPLLIAHMPDDGVIGHLSTLEAMVDEQWPLMAQVLDLTEPQAKAAATAIQQQLVAQRAAHEFHVAMAEDAVAKARDGLN